MPNVSNISLTDRRALGKTGLLVSPVSFGCSPFGNLFGNVDEKDAAETVFEAIKSGINFFDVSPYYGLTRAETVLGKALRQLPRDSFVLSTKVGRYGENKFDFSAERVTKSVEESMERLGVEHIDIINCHDIEFGDLDQIVNETVPALLKLKEAGKVGAIGITGYPLEIFPYVIECCDPGAVDVILTYCNYCLQNDRLKLLLPPLKRNGVGVMNASALSMGLLTQRGAPDWHPADEETRKAAKRASDMCVERGEDLSAVALKWAFSADPELIQTTLVGIGTMRSLEKNKKLVAGDLTSELLDDVDTILKPVKNRRWKSGNF